MEAFCLLFLVLFFTINSLDKSKSVQLEETPLKIIDEIFGEGWWDNDKDEEWNKLALEQNALHQIDRQNTQIGQIEPNSTDQLGQIEPNSTDQLGQIEPNSTDQLGQIEPNSTDQLGQIEPNSTDQNAPLTESDHSDNANSIENIVVDEQKRKIIDKFHEMKAELKRDGFNNSYHHQIDETVAKELGITYRTIYAWKRKLGQTKPQHRYSHSEQKELLKLYYEIKDKPPKISDGAIAKRFKIDVSTLRRWKKLHPNSVNGHSVEKDAAGSNVPEIENSNLGSILMNDQSFEENSLMKLTQ